MESVALDPGVFIRSLATRGSLGGLSSATRVVADVLDAFGFDRILIETVGVGQSELDIARSAESTLVVLVPESGDSIQTLKAGLMEIADLFAVNKADRPGADRLRNDIELMLGMRAGLGLTHAPAHHGVDLGGIANPGRVAREAARGEQDGAVDAARPAHRRGQGRGDRRGRRRARPPLPLSWNERGIAAAPARPLARADPEVAEQRLRRRVWDDPEIQAFVEGSLADVEAGTSTPFGIADELLRRGAGILTRTVT